MGRHIRDRGDDWFAGNDTTRQYPGGGGTTTTTAGDSVYATNQTLVIHTITMSSSVNGTVTIANHAGTAVFVFDVPTAVPVSFSATFASILASLAACFARSNLSISS